MKPDSQLSPIPSQLSTALTKLPVAGITGTWDGARKWRDAAVRMEQGKLFCQVMLGFELIALRSSLSVENGKKTDLSQIGKGDDGWVQMLDKEVGLSRTSAYRMMEMAEACKPRLKKLPELRGFDPCSQAVTALPAKQQTALTAAVKKLTDGTTQVEFMRELGLAKLPAGAGVTGRAKGQGGRPPAPSLSEQARLLKESALMDLHQIAKLLDGFADKFCLLDDADCSTLESVCERHVKAVRRWLAKPAPQRDAHEIEALFRKQ